MFMKVSQIIRSLVAVRLRVSVVAAVCMGTALVGSARAQGHGQRHPAGPRGPMIFSRPTPVMPAPRAGLQLSLGGRWWDEGKMMKKFSLRTDQKRRMDEIFETNRGTLQTLYTNYQHEEARLVSLPPGDLQDETRVFAAIDRVAQARTELEKANAHILVQIRQQLDPGQLDQLDKEIANAAR